MEGGNLVLVRETWNIPFSLLRIFTSLNAWL